jgi:hypothetical protein
MSQFLDFFEGLADFRWIGQRTTIVTGPQATVTTPSEHDVLATYVPGEAAAVVACVDCGRWFNVTP